jgi:hypothetical protein
MDRRIKIERVVHVVKIWISTDLPFDEKENATLSSGFTHECQDIHHAELFKRYLIKTFRFTEKEK